MKTKNFAIVTIVFLLSLNSCVLRMDSHLASSDLNVEIDGNGYIAFAYVDEEYSYRKKRNYELLSIRMLGYGCEVEHCDITVWSMRFRNDGPGNNKNMGPPLPRKITYGGQYDELRTIVQPKQLRYDLLYNVMVGIRAYDNVERAIRFAAEVDFIIREGGGNPFVEIVEVRQPRKTVVLTDAHNIIQFPLR